MEQFLMFVASILNVDSSEINGETEYNVYEPWTSIMHLRLVMEIENEYDIEIPMDEVPKIRTLNELFAYIK